MKFHPITIKHLLDNKVIYGFINRPIEEITQDFTRIHNYPHDREVIKVFHLVIRHANIFGVKMNLMDSEIRIYLLFLNKIVTQFRIDHPGITNFEFTQEFMPFYNQLSTESIEQLHSDAEETFNQINTFEPNIGLNNELLSLIRDYAEAIPEEAEQLLNDFDHFFRSEKRKMMLYPSAGIDDAPIRYLSNHIGAEYFGSHSIFIGIDFWQHGPQFENQMRTTIPLNFSENAQLHLSKLKIQNNDFWLLHFAECTNEEIMIELIKRRIPIDTLYTKCDGITTGMGGPDDVFRVYSNFYACFYKQLCLKRIITEYGLEFWNQRNIDQNGYEEGYYNQQKLWLQQNFDDEIQHDILERIENCQNMHDVMTMLGGEYPLDDNYPFGNHDPMRLIIIN